MKHHIYNAIFLISVVAIITTILFAIIGFIEGQFNVWNWIPFSRFALVASSIVANGYAVNFIINLK